MRPFKPLILLAALYGISHAAPYRGSIIDPGDSDVLGTCNRRFFPVFENRPFSDAPFQLMVAWRDGERSISPAAGLDLYALWYTPLRPRCTSLGAYDARAPATGVSLHFMLSANATLANLETQTTLQIADGNGGSTATEVDKSNLGALLGGMGGFLLDITFDSGGHDNRIALAGLVGYGYFLGSEADGATFTLGVGVVFSR